MADTRRCARCGALLPTVDPALPCPACLLALAANEPPLGPNGLSADGATVSPAPARIGPYRILETLGEGGMGVVYLAEQDEPLRRQVALKIIKLGMDTREIVARFDSERQAVALMDHPNIASVYDAGATEHGRPYFVMEYVPGLPITEYCDRHRLSTRARLSLFRDVCAAVQHAHQKGIIHRDLKPTNVLVMEQDGKGVPKVIDFGVAKAIDQRLTERTLFTAHGLLIGTPEYMSPEQSALGEADLDTRTDIYSLGVLLYELLVGALPFEIRTLRRAGYEELRRVIREEEPLRPSARLVTLGATASDAAERRDTETSTLQRQLRGDLDWIVLKALEKDPARRYASASEFAADIGRHLEDDPVAAGPPSATYRVKKFARKHKGAVGAMVAIVIVLVIGFTVSTGLFLRAEGLRYEAEQQRLTAEASAQYAVAQRKAALKERQATDAVVGYLNRMSLRRSGQSLDAVIGPELMMIPDFPDASFLQAEFGTDNPRRLYRESWEVVKGPGRGRADYRLALRRAEAAFLLAPTETALVTAIGGAHYRLNDYPEAAGYLTIRLSANFSARQKVFLAMARHRLGNRQNARRLVAELRAMTQIRPADYEEESDLEMLLREAEAMITTPGGAQPKY